MSFFIFDDQNFLCVVVGKACADSPTILRSPQQDLPCAGRDDRWLTTGGGSDAKVTSVVCPPVVQSAERAIVV